MYMSKVCQVVWDTMSEKALHTSVGNPNWCLILGFCGSGSYLPVGSGSWDWQRARGRWFQHRSAARLTASITFRQSFNASRQLTYAILLSAAVVASETFYPSAVPGEMQMWQVVQVFPEDFFCRQGYGGIKILATFTFMHLAGIFIQSDLQK